MRRIFIICDSVSERPREREREYQINFCAEKGSSAESSYAPSQLPHIFHREKLQRCQKKFFVAARSISPHSLSLFLTLPLTALWSRKKEKLERSPIKFQQKNIKLMDLRTRGPKPSLEPELRRCWVVEWVSGWVGEWLPLAGCERVLSRVLQPNNNSFSLVPLTAVSRALSLCDKRDSGDNCSAFRLLCSLSLSLAYFLSRSHSLQSKHSRHRLFMATQ